MFTGVGVVFVVVVVDVVFSAVFFRSVCFSAYFCNTVAYLFFTLVRLMMLFRTLSGPMDFSPFF